MTQPQATVDEANVPTQAEKRWFSSGAQGVEYADLAAPVVADPDRIVTASQIADGTEAIAAQPDVPRNLTGLLVDANDSVTSTVTMKGRDMAGRAVQEVMEIALGTGKSFTGTQIFAVVDSVVVTNTSGSAAGDNLTVGVGNVIGLPKPIAGVGAVKHTYLGAGVLVTPDAVAFGDLSSGVDASGATYNGTKVMKVAYRPGE